MNWRSEVLHGSRTEPERNAVQVPIAPGLVADSPIRVYVEDCNGYDLVLDVVAIPAVDNRAGRFACRSLLVQQAGSGPPITTEGLRGVPVAGLTKRAGVDHVLSVEFSGGDWVHLASRQLTEEICERLRKVGPRSETLSWVAYIYRLALVLGEPPTKSVEQTLGIARSTAGRWVAEARAKGFLADAEGAGKAGG